MSEGDYSMCRSGEEPGPLASLDLLGNQGSGGFQVTLSRT